MLYIILIDLHQQKILSLQNLANAAVISHPMFYCTCHQTWRTAEYGSQRAGVATQRQLVHHGQPCPAQTQSVFMSGHRIQTTLINLLGVAQV